MVKNVPASAGDRRVAGLTPGSRRPPGGGNSSPLQDSCLENPMDRGAWRAAVHGAAESWTQLKQLSTHALAKRCRTRAVPLIISSTPACVDEQITE